MNTGSKVADHCIIIGGSHAAAQLAQGLRLEGWKGGISIISDEHLPPYHRPPLSKTFLAGRTPENALLIRPPEFYQKHEIHLDLGTRVAAINRSDRCIQTADGRTLKYSKLALTTGARVRTLNIPGTNLPGVFYLRSLQDADGIRPYIVPGKSAVIIGGGYIGLETAACLRNLGMDVTILEALPRILQRVSAPEVAAFYQRIHRGEGIEICTETTVSAIAGNSSVTMVHCANGKEVRADLVIIGIGVLPNTALADNAGLATDNGIRVNEFCQSSDPDIVAAGDCTNHFNPIYGRWIRLESVQNASDQARIAAATLCNKPRPYNTLPWFWSDQYDLKLQIAGLSQGFDRVVIRGDSETGRSFAAFYFKEDQFIAVDAINRPMEFMLGRRALVQGFQTDPRALANESLSVQEILTL